MSGIIDVTLRRDRWTGQMIYPDDSTPLGYVEMAVHRAAVMAAAGVPVPEGLYQRLLAVSDSLRGLDERTVRQLIGKAWGAMEEEMRVTGITHQDVTAALGRHSGCISCLHETVGIVLAEKGPRRPVAAAVVGQQAAVAQLSIEVAVSDRQSTVQDLQRTRKQRETQRKRECRKRKK